MTLNRIDINTILEFLITFIICLIGSSIKDIYNTMTNKNTKVNILKIIISSIMSSIVVFSFSEHIYKTLNPRMYFLICTIIGTLGFEIIGIVSNIKNWFKVLYKFKENLKYIDLSDIEFDNEEVFDKDEEDKKSNK